MATLLEKKSANLQLRSIFGLFLSMFVHIIQRAMHLEQCLIFWEKKEMLVQSFSRKKKNNTASGQLFTFDFKR